jgi:PGF-CTERM protein
VTVLVERPARARVTDVEVSTRAADQGDIVVVTASVVNDAEIPGEVLVVFTRDFQSVAERQVYLPPENTTEVSTGVTVPEPGEVLLSAGEARAVRVTVTPAETPTTTTSTSTSTTTTTTASETTGGSAPGFTAALAVVALVLAALLARRR